jgi:glycine/D-amino acid oxidase-like deaminating enzyme
MVEVGSETTARRIRTPDSAIVIGGGFYGLRVALFLRQSLGIPRVTVFEKEPSVMQRASMINQARVHNGYHYPRSILTGYRSRVNFPRFVEEYRDAIVDTFDHYYAVARVLSKVNARQFELFCDRIGAYYEPAPPLVYQLFDRHRIERAYVVREPTFDASIVRSMLLSRIAVVGGIELSLGDEVHSLARGVAGSIRVEAASGAHQADRVISTTYSRINLLHRRSGLDQVSLHHEISEIVLVQVPDELRRAGLTIIDGPFFSVLPHPGRHLHALSHVRFTPRYRWAEGPGLNEFDPQQMLELASQESGFASMRADATRYVPVLRDMTHESSIREVKTVLARSNVNDGRPILYLPHHGIPNYTGIMGGKLDNVYDALTELERAHVGV